MANPIKDFDVVKVSLRDDGTAYIETDPTKDYIACIAISSNTVVSEKNINSLNSINSFDSSKATSANNYSTIFYVYDKNKIAFNYSHLVSERLVKGASQLNRPNFQALSMPKYESGTAPSNPVPRSYYNNINLQVITFTKSSGTQASNQIICTINGIQFVGNCDVSSVDEVASNPILSYCNLQNINIPSYSNLSALKNSNTPLTVGSGYYPAYASGLSIFSDNTFYLFTTSENLAVVISTAPQNPALSSEYIVRVGAPPLLRYISSLSALYTNTTSNDAQARFYYSGSPFVNVINQSFNSCGLSIAVGNKYINTERARNAKDDQFSPPVLSLPNTQIYKRFPVKNASGATTLRFGTASCIIGYSLNKTRDNSIILNYFPTIDGTTPVYDSNGISTGSSAVCNYLDTTTLDPVDIYNGYELTVFKITDSTSAVNAYYIYDNFSKFKVVKSVGLLSDSSNSIVLPSNSSIGATRYTKLLLDLQQYTKTEILTNGTVDFSSAPEQNMTQDIIDIVKNRIDTSYILLMNPNRV